MMNEILIKISQLLNKIEEIYVERILMNEQIAFLYPEIKF